MSTRKPKWKENDRVLTTVRKWTVGKSPNKGTKFVRVQFDNYITWTGWLTPKTKQRVIETLGIMGFKGSDLSMLGHPNALDTENEVIAVIESSREYKGNHYFDAKFINKNTMFGFDEKAKDLLDEFKDEDTRAYLDETIDLNQGQAEGYPSGHPDYDTPEFTASDIPF